MFKSVGETLRTGDQRYSPRERTCRIRGGNRMINTLHVVSVGSQDQGTFVRDALLTRSRCRLYVASSTWDLSVLLGTAEIDVAILHNTVSLLQMRILTAYIRGRWPSAKILLIQRKELKADYSTYDERIAPGSSARALLAAIERLGACARRSRLPLAKESCSQFPKQKGRSTPELRRTLQNVYGRS
jgi:hypothetical protein